MLALTLCVPAWVILVIITIGMFIPACIYKSQGEYDLGALWNFVIALVVALSAWLIYFIFLYLKK